MVRFKNRWVLFQIAQEPILVNGKVIIPKDLLELNDSAISKSIFQSTEMYYGHFGKGQGSVQVKWYNPTTKIGILRIPRAFLDMYLSTMFYMKEVASVSCSFNILHVSGTVIFIQQEAIDWDRRYYLKEQAEAEKRGENFSFVDKIEKTRQTLAQLT